MKMRQVLGGSQTGKTMVSSASPRCDICYADIKVGDVMVDGKTQMGPWANMCGPCHGDMGVGLGIGKGQKYERIE